LTFVLLINDLHFTTGVVRSAPTITPATEPTVPRRPALSLAQILAWADHHFEETGHWPRTSSGPVLAYPSLNWRRIDNALRYGLRGLKPGSSLAQMLNKKRGARNQKALPALTVHGAVAAPADAAVERHLEPVGERRDQPALQGQSHRHLGHALLGHVLPPFQVGAEPGY
jgi:hypothetical protein